MIVIFGIVCFSTGLGLAMGLHGSGWGWVAFGFGVPGMAVWYWGIVKEIDADAQELADATAVVASDGWLDCTPTCEDE